MVRNKNEFQRDNIEDNKKEKETESYLKKKIKQVQLLAAFVGSMFIAEGVSAQSSGESILDKPTKIELVKNDIESINKLHYSIDSLIKVLEKQVSHNKDSKKIDMSIYGAKYPGNPKYWNYKNIGVGKNKDFVTFSVKDDSTDINYGSRENYSFSIGKNNFSQVSLYNAEQERLVSENPDETATSVENNLITIKSKIENYIEKTK